MSVCGRPDTAAILLPSPMALPPLRNGGRRIPEASANDGCTRGRPRRHGSVRPSPETCAGNQVQRPGVEWYPPDRHTTSLRGSEGDTHFVRNYNSALREQIFDVTKAEREPEIEPDRLMNDFRREPISGVADFRHALWLPSHRRRDNAAPTSLSHTQAMTIACGRS